MKLKVIEPANPTDRFVCERFACEMTLDACARRQAATYKPSNYPVYIPCGSAQHAARLGETQERTGRKRSERVGAGQVCAQGLENLARLPANYEPAPHWTHRAARRGMIQNRAERAVVDRLALPAPEELVELDDLLGEAA